MLISPPFLPARLDSETEDAWIDRCMAGGQPGDGAFPLSFNLGWHGGLHLMAPMNGSQPEPVRAIADGTVVVRRLPTSQPSGPLPVDHPLAYRGRWTDNGLVVLRHETEIGDGADAKVVFFSIYMHLSAVHSAVQPGRTIYRKAELGTAGQIYGDTRRCIHFEIVCDDTNLPRLIGRASGDLPTTADGRLDAVYGQIYFLLPGGTPFYERKPLDHLVAAHVQPPRPSAKAAMPALQPLQPCFTSGVDDILVIALRYAGGEGPTNERGDARLTTMRLDGTVIGAAPPEANAEYDLYTRANEISTAYPAGNRPAPSAVYELLRFGRVVNTDNESLRPNDVPHWRKVCYPGGEGWVDLNAANVRKFSDADFPHWQKWQLIDDSADGDSRCDSPTLRAWLDVSGDGQIDPIEATARLNDPVLASRLARTVCKFPSEWTAATVDQRWGWLKTSTAENPYPFTDEDFELLRRHIQALAFLPVDSGLADTHWHFQPREFVRQFRNCGWLSPAELVQLLPGNHPTGFEQMKRRLTLGHQSARQTMPAAMTSALNRVCRKYLLERLRRRAHFWGQIVQETDQLQTVREYASGADYEGRADLGNRYPGDGQRFRGRGVIQVTGRVNYRRYSDYHGGDFSTEPNNLMLENNAYIACDASTFYWIAEETRDKVEGSWRLDGLIGINRRADEQSFTRLTDERAIREDVSRVTRQVNRAERHLENRLKYFKYAYLLASDVIESLPHGNLRP